MNNTIKLIIFIVAMGMLSSLTSCSGHKSVNHKDSIEYATYVGWPDTTVQIDGEPIYVPIEWLGFHQPGDSVWIDRKTNILTIPLYWTEENHKVLDTIGLMKVQMAERLNNKWIARGK